MAGGCGSGVCLEGAAVAGVAELRSLPSLSYPPARALPLLELGEPSGARAASEVCGPRAAAWDPAACRVHTSTSTAPEHSSCRFILTWVKCSCRSPHSPRDIWRRTLGKGSMCRRFEAMVWPSSFSFFFPFPSPLTPIQDLNHKLIGGLSVCMFASPRRFTARWNATMEMATVSPRHGTTTLEISPHAPRPAPTPLPPVVFCSQEEQAEQLW